MPLEERSPDNFTKDWLLLGFSKIEFRPLISGVLGTPVDLGILSAQELAKEVSVLELPDGSSGTITVAREILNSLKPSFNVSTFNFRFDLAQYIFGAPSTSEVTADAASAVVNELIRIPSGANASDTFLPLINGSVDDTAANLSLVCSLITDETVGIGDGTLGAVSGEYALAFKPAAIGDVSGGSITVGGVSYAPIAVASAAAGLEVEVVVGAGATSGDLQFFNGGGAVDVTGTILATYTPNPTLQDDFAAASPDMLLDPLLGRIRFPLIDSGTSKDGTSLIREAQEVELDYLYNRKAHHTMKPFTQGGGTYSGACTIKHLPDVGTNFIWNVPSCSIRIDDNSIVFGADDFGVGTLVLNINDAGGSDRFGTMQFASETEAGA